jgi:hypothetical protein
MKVLKRQPINPFSEPPDLATPPDLTSESVEFPHDSTELEELASYAINRRLELQSTKDWRLLATRFRMQLRGNTASKASLFKEIMVTEFDAVNYPEQLRVKVIENLVEGLISDAMEKVDQLYRLDKSFWTRFRYLFTKKIN